MVLTYYQEIGIIMPFYNHTVIERHKESIEGLVSLSTGMRQYLACVKNLEIQKETLAKTILGIDRTTKKLGIPGKITPLQNPIELNLWQMYSVPIVLTAIIAAGALFLFFIAAEYMAMWNEPETSITAAAWFCIILSAICIFFIKRGYDAQKIMYEENEDAINQQYHEDRENDKRRVSNELVLKDKYQQARDQLYATYCQTDRTLKALYAKNIIYSKYQNDLVAICMFCEYFESGRCTTLTGHEGAYNIYEQELRMGIIIGKLDVIIQKLDEIQSNQYALYTAVKQISNQQNQILNNLKQISSNQDMQSAQLEHIRYNTAALKQNSDIAMIYALF